MHKKPMTRISQITVSLDNSTADQKIRRGAEALAHQYDVTLSSVGRAALSVAIDNPQLIESRLTRRWPGRRLAR